MFLIIGVLPSKLFNQCQEFEESRSAKFLKKHYLIPLLEIKLFEFGIGIKQRLAIVTTTAVPDELASINTEMTLFG